MSTRLNRIFETAAWCTAIALILIACVGCEAEDASDDAAASTAQQSAALDQRLVGRWLYTWTAASGGVTAGMGTWFVLQSHGTDEDGGGRAAAGGGGARLL